MRPRPAAPLAILLVLAALLGGCVTPADDAHTYAEKARLTSEDAVSELRTAALAGRSWLDGKLPTTYLEVAVVDSESALNAVASTFGAVQPPADDESDRLGQALGSRLDDAADALEELRTATRRSQRHAIASAVESIIELADQIEHIMDRPR